MTLSWAGCQPRSGGGWRSCSFPTDLGGGKLIIRGVSGAGLPFAPPGVQARGRGRQDAGCHPVAKSPGKHSPSPEGRRQPLRQPGWASLAAPALLGGGRLRAPGEGCGLGGAHPAPSAQVPLCPRPHQEPRRWPRSLRSGSPRLCLSPWHPPVEMRLWLRK